MITTPAGSGPADFADVRTTNLAVVLRYVRANAPCSRAEIATTTGLNKATVSSLVAELIERRLLRETGLAEQRIGRPAILLVLDGAPYAAVGLAVDADRLTVVATDLAGTRLLCRHRAFRGREVSPAEAVRAIASLARRAAARLAGEGRQVLGLTVAVPGLVDRAGSVRFASGLGWHDVDLAGGLRRALRRSEFPVAVENNANVAALAEYRHGSRRGTANLICLAGDSGIGAGIVAGGRLLRGGLGFAGEIGHVTFDPGGPRCTCGRRGCIEAYAGPAAIVGRLSDTPDDAALDVLPGIEDAARRAEAGDAEVLAVLTEAGRAVGHAAAVLANIVDPEYVVLGGRLRALSPWLLPAAEAEFAAATVAPGTGGHRLIASTLDDAAVAVGAAAKVLDAIDSGQLTTIRAT